MENNFYFVKSEKNKSGRLYDIYEDDNRETRLGVLQMRFGILYLFPVIEEDILWGDVLNSWIFEDVNKSELEEDEKTEIFAKCINEIKEFFEDEISVCD